MTIASKLRDYLQKEHVPFQTLQHPEAFKASEIAGLLHVPGRQFAKCVIVKADGKYILCVIPATHVVDFDKLKALAKAKEIILVKEQEASRLFPDFEPGAEPPFGNLYSLPVYAEAILKKENEIVVNGGTHTDLVKIKWADFERLAKPVLGSFGKHI